jgi:hypothetical protein
LARWARKEKTQRCDLKDHQLGRIEISFILVNGAFETASGNREFTVFEHFAVKGWSHSAFRIATSHEDMRGNGGKDTSILNLVTRGV